MQNLPDGVVTFLFTDIEGSTRLWEEAPDVMMEAIRHHDQAIEETVQAHGGAPVRPRGEGDSRFIVFRSAIDAVQGCAEMQRQLAAMDWVTPKPLRVRASLHTGEADLQLGDYYGSTVNRAARLRAVAHGGQTVMSGSTWELVQDQLPAGVTVTDLGQHRLRDLTRPEHIYQINITGLDHFFPPLTSLDAVINNLPEQLTDLIGREVELAEAKSLLDETRFLTILAAGGAGKTRLAIQIAADLITEFPDGVFFIPLADLESSRDIIQAVAESLGLGLSSDEGAQIQLLTYLANKRQLLVFDNFEHLSEGASIVSEILKAAPEVTIIATSRSKLNLTGESIFTLSGLETSWETPEEALQASGVLLFMDAAKRANHGFSLQKDDIAALAKILRLIGGMPLGIVLAAAWVDLLPVSEIASEIAQSMDILQTDVGDVPDRHRSVRAVFDYTWELLSPEDREKFAALSVFRGGFTREAAQQVTGTSLHDLAILSNKSLVMPSPDSGRYSVHELLRQYGESELKKDSGQYDRIRKAHTAYYSGITEEAYKLIYNSDEGRMLEIIEGDHDNIRRAWRHSLATNDASGARKMVIGLWLLYEIRGWAAPAVDLFGEALEAFDEHSQDEATVVVRAVSSSTQAWFLTLLGQHVNAETAAARATEILRSNDDPEALLLTLQCWAISLAYSYRLEDWINVTEQGISLAKKIQDPLWTAVMKQWRGGAAVTSGDFGTGKSLLLEGMQVYQQFGEQYWLSLNLNHQAQAAMGEGRTDDAIDLFSRSAQIARRLGGLRVLQLSLTGLGDAYVAARKFSAAELAFTESLAVAEQMGLVREMLSLITKIARAQAAGGKKREAVEMLSTVLAEPISAQHALFESTSIADNVLATLSEIKDNFDPEEYAAAKVAGTARSYSEVAKDLIESLSEQLPSTSS
jgi:predicted ATPase/class 3 adenylate cyclase